MYPAPRFCHIIAGEHVSATIARNLSREPLRLCVCADENEQTTAILTARLIIGAIDNVDCRQVGIALYAYDFRN